jgi:hypothetical protein
MAAGASVSGGTNTNGGTMDKHRLDAKAKSNQALADFVRKHLEGAPFSEWTQANLIEILKRLDRT